MGAVSMWLRNGRCAYSNLRPQRLIQWWANERLPETLAENLGKKQFLSAGVAKRAEYQGPLHGKRLLENDNNTEESKAERRSETNS